MNYNLTHLDQLLTLSLNGSDSLFWDNLVLCVTNTFAWSLVIVMLLIVIFRNNDIRESIIILVSIGLMIAVADGICSGIVKPLVARWRPTQDPLIMYLVDVVDGYRGGNYGFFSGHACNTFCMALFLSRLFAHRTLSVVLFIWAATTTFTRIYLGVHYVGDILVGLTVGLLIGWLFAWLFKKVMTYVRSSKLTSEQFTATGYKKSDMQAMLAVIFFNYVGVLIVSMAMGV